MAGQADSSPGERLREVFGCLLINRVLRPPVGIDDLTQQLGGRFETRRGQGRHEGLLMKRAFGCQGGHDPLLSGKLFQEQTGMQAQQLGKIGRRYVVPMGHPCGRPEGLAGRFCSLGRAAPIPGHCSAHKALFLAFKVIAVSWTLKKVSGNHGAAH